ncbi:hypothetical protein SAMN02787142_2841 [Burkholderia sp. WP9]|uniref:hypothetical protein n=1 Tax=Burkholderia sp. WP9 TaxID=1500263 RepID=UPI000899DDA6|nr:hypothetical protein [Burkholderia sp. WP9]SED25162.1 hypothetical protein SAMN02787142_2841 [Burkholderia sp. WP9]
MNAIVIPGTSETSSNKPEVFKPDFQKNQSVARQCDKNRADHVLQSFNKALSGVKKSAIGYRNVLNTSLSNAYALFHVYISNLNREVEFRKILEPLCIEADLTITTGKTKPQHMIVGLTFGKLLTATLSQRARLLEKASGEKIKPENFATWLSGKGGVVKALESCETATNRENRKAASANIKQNAKLGRKKLQDVLLGFVESQPEYVDPSIEKDTPAVAIITLSQDGSFKVRAFVKDESVLDAAYAAHVAPEKSSN